MALIACSECGKEVSDKAAACPSCGNPLRPSPPAQVQVQLPPTPKKKTSGCAWIALIFVVLFFAGMLGLLPDSGGSRPSSPSRPAEPRVSEADCRKDLQCWGDKHHVEASMRCEKAVEAQAKYQAEWTDGMLESKFPRMMWADEAAGTITYGGDKVKFQNGFGAWQIHTYLCTYDPASKSVTQALVMPRG